MHRCWNCSKVTGIAGRPGRSDDCPYCRAELRTCRGCRFYEPMRSGECSEPRAEPPTEKEKVNFCDYFVTAEIAAPVVEAKPGGWTTNKSCPTQSDARAALDKLFSK